MDTDHHQWIKDPLPLIEIVDEGEGVALVSCETCGTTRAMRPKNAPSWARSHAQKTHWARL